MGLREVLVLADEDDGRNPKLFCFMLLESVPNDLCLTDVCARSVCERIAARQDVNACLVQFLASQ